MKHLKRELTRSRGRMFLLSLGFLLSVSGELMAQPGCLNVDLQSNFIAPSAAVISTTGTSQILAGVGSNGPCNIPQGEAEVRITFQSGNGFLQAATPLNFVDNCVPARWAHISTTTAGGLTTLLFRNDGGPLPAFTNCAFMFNVGGTGFVSAGPITISMLSSLSLASTVGDINGLNQSANTAVTVSMVAPVIISDIKATASSCNGILDWRTQTEDNIDRFEVQYSTDGASFSNVGTVLPKNNVSGAAYKYANNQGTAKGYYRLKIVDRNGSFSYSRIVIVDTKCSGKKTVTLYPNPLAVNQNLSVIASGYEGTVKGELVAMSGQVMRTYNLKNGMNSLPVENLAQGTYMFRVSDATGESESFRVVIMK